jgi:hypothetical protein|tara:strand:+ start:41572 stop:41799 length:228 start_codon:yes stop_codon:yes gene_type:complete
MKLFKNKELVHDPKVIIRNKDDKDVSFVIKQLEGAFYRVIPNNAREIAFLQGLKKNIFVYTPASGDGLIVTLNLF